MMPLLLIIVGLAVLDPLTILLITIQQVHLCYLCHCDTGSLTCEAFKIATLFATVS